MSGIITSSRIASGRSDSAVAMPSEPDGAVNTSQPPTISRLAFATSRMSSSSSMTRIRRAAISLTLPPVSYEPFEERHDALLELLRGDAPLGLKLGIAEAQALAVALVDLAGRVHYHRNIAHPFARAKPFHDGVPVAVRKNQIQHDQIGSQDFAEMDRLATGRGVERFDLASLERRDQHPGQVNVVLDDEHPCGAARAGGGRF